MKAYSNLIIIEGQMGSGKTTTACWLTRELQYQGLNARCLWEGSAPHPLRAMTDYSKPFELWHETSVSEFVTTALAKWRSFVDTARHSDVITVVDGQLYHGDLTCLLLMGASNRQLESFVTAIEVLATPLSPKLIYFHQQDSRQALRDTCCKRGREWLDFQLNWKTNSPYCQMHNLEGFDGYLTLYTQYCTLTGQLFAKSTFDKLIIENSTGDWPDYRQRVLDWLSDQRK